MNKLATELDCNDHHSLLQSACCFEQIAIRASNDACSFPAIINGIIASELFLRSLLKKQGYQSIDKNSHELGKLFLLDSNTQHKIMAGTPSINVSSFLSDASSVLIGWSDFGRIKTSILLALVKVMHDVCLELFSKPAASGGIQVYTPDRAAEILSVDAQTIRIWLRRGTLHGSKIGTKLWRISEEDIKQFLAENRKS